MNSTLLLDAWPTNCAQTLYASLPRSFVSRGLSPTLRTPTWQPTMVGVTGLYAVDFGAAVRCGDRIVRADIDPGQGGFASPVTICGMRLVAWVSWLTVGMQSVSATAVTASGALIQLDAQIATVSSSVVLNNAAPEFAPNALAYGNVFFPDATGVAPLVCE